MTVNTYLPGTIVIPSSLLITNITKAFPMVVTVSIQSAKSADMYIVGQLVRLTVPITYGMFQADNLTAQIIAINGLDLALDIDSRGFDTFVIPPSGEQPASLAPAGSRNLQYDNTTTQVPFQSLNNVGN